jgi:hypothetical protein
MHCTAWQEAHNLIWLEHCESLRIIRLCLEQGSAAPASAATLDATAQPVRNG